MKFENIPRKESLAGKYDKESVAAKIEHAYRSSTELFDDALNRIGLLYEQITNILDASEDENGAWDTEKGKEISSLIGNIALAEGDEVAKKNAVAQFVAYVAAM